MKIKTLIKYVLFPRFRRSIRVARYIERGYNQQEALAKVRVIEA